MKRRKKTIFPIIILFSTILALTNICAVVLFNPLAVKASKAAVLDHFGCDDISESPAPAEAIATANSAGMLMPCCIGRDRNNDLALFSAEKPLLLEKTTLAANHILLIENPVNGGRTADLWPPPEKSIIDSTIIRT